MSCQAFCRRWGWHEPLMDQFFFDTTSVDVQATIEYQVGRATRDCSTSLSVHEAADIVRDGAFLFVRCVFESTRGCTRDFFD
jgi:hypothetical protein